MQGKLAKLSFLAIAVLAVATGPTVWGQQPTSEARKLTQSPSRATVYEDTQWAPNQDIELLKTNLEISGDQAESYLRRRAAVEQQVMAVRLQYLPEFRKVLSGRETALFYQIDWRLDLMINLQLAQAPM